MYIYMYMYIYICMYICYIIYIYINIIYIYILGGFRYTSITYIYIHILLLWYYVYTSYTKFKVAILPSFNFRPTSRWLLCCSQCFSIALALSFLGVSSVNPASSSPVLGLLSACHLAQHTSQSLMPKTHKSTTFPLQFSTAFGEGGFSTCPGATGHRKRHQ